MSRRPIKNVPVEKFNEALSFIADLQNEVNRLTAQNTVPAEPVAAERGDGHETLLSTIERQQKEIQSLKEENERLLSVLRLARHERFGVSSEKSPSPYVQVSLFNEVEAEAQIEAETPEEEPTIEKVDGRRKKKKGQRQEDLSRLAQQTIEVRLSEEERHCPVCDTVMDDCGVTERHHLVYIPATVEHLVYRQHAYCCPHCKEQAEKEQVLAAPLPAPLLPKALVSPSLLAHVVAEKYDKAVPLYRIERTFADKRFSLRRQTMARWLIQVQEAYLDPFYQALHRTLLTATHIQADETTVQVLKEPGRDPTQISRMWVYHTTGGAPPITLFNYQATRGTCHAVEFLQGFTGTVQADGYSAYDALPGVMRRAGCHAHARRKFKEAERALPKATPPEMRKDLDAILALYRQLYAVEASVKEEQLEGTEAQAYLLQQRQKRSVPVFDQLFKRMKVLMDQDVLPQSRFGQAIRYALKQEQSLRIYLDDPCVPIDTNEVERAIRPFAVGRNNWMFCDTVAGARASACYYSILETAKANGLDPRAYMEWLLDQLAGKYNPKEIDYERYFPWSSEVPESCRTPRPSR